MESVDYGKTIECQLIWTHTLSLTQLWEEFRKRQPQPTFQLCFINYYHLLFKACEQRFHLCRQRHILGAKPINCVGEDMVVNSYRRQPLRCQIGRRPQVRETGTNAWVVGSHLHQKRNKTPKVRPPIDSTSVGPSKPYPETKKGKKHQQNVKGKSNNTWYCRQNGEDELTRWE